MKFRISSEYGILEEIRNGRVHKGLDFAMPSGTELRTVADGIVTRVVDYGSDSLGKGVFIRTEDGHTHIFGHMQDISVRAGQKLKEGDLIGLSGNSGHSTGAHLHFGIKNNAGEFLDPTPLAEKVATFSGDVGDVTSQWFAMKGPLIQGIEIAKQGGIKEQIVEGSKEYFMDMILAFLQAIGEVALDLIYSITLVGGGVLIILKVAGYKDGYRWAGILFVINILIKRIFGG